MAKYRRKPTLVEATQWFRNGDHPNDDCEIAEKLQSDGKMYRFRSEGKIVRYFRDPNLFGEALCSHCDHPYMLHGFIDTAQGGHRVCPGDWIVTLDNGENYPCKPDVFDATYEFYYEEMKVPALDTSDVPF